MTFWYGAAAVSLINLAIAPSLIWAVPAAIIFMVSLHRVVTR